MSGDAALRYGLHESLGLYVPCILITVDVEDWFQVENLRSHFPRSIWDSCELRLEGSMDKLLEIFSHHGVKATFFVLGWIARRLPHLVNEIVSQGHEIASHGYGHELCTNLSMDALRKDLYRSKTLLEDISGQQVYGYRAPSFTITQSLVRLLAEQAYHYDSSFNSFSLHGRYGKLDNGWTEEKPGLLKNNRGLYELPVSNFNFLGKVIPWGGGGYFRLFPLSLFNAGVKRILDRCGVFLFYCHPWEFDPEQPRVRGLRPDLGFRHYINIEKNLEKLSSFLTAFSCCSFLNCSSFILEHVYPWPLAK